MQMRWARREELVRKDTETVVFQRILSEVVDGRLVQLPDVQTES